jgi:carboxymethylenebutenolidase
MGADRSWTHRRPPNIGQHGSPVTDGRRGRWPGVVVVHDSFGITDDMREQADWLAAAGCVAVVPDPVRRKAAARCVKAMFASSAA